MRRKKQGPSLLLDLPEPLLVHIASMAGPKDAVRLMLARKCVKQLIERHWDTVMSPLDGSMDLDLVHQTRLANWRKFFAAGRQLRLRSLTITLNTLLDFDPVKDLMVQIGRSCGASLRELRVTGRFCPLQWMTALTSLRQMTLDLILPFFADEPLVYNFDFSVVPALQTLDLQMSRLYCVINQFRLPTSLRRLTLYSLDRLSFRANDEVCLHLATLPNLRELCVVGPSNLACAELRDVTALTKLCISDRFMPGGADCLPASLRELELGDQLWGGLSRDEVASCVEPLSRLTALTRLALTNNCARLYPDALASLSALYHLRHLSLVDVTSPVSLAPLSNLSCLTFLSLSVSQSFAQHAANNLGPGPQTDFARTLAVLKRMKEVHLCRVPDADAAAFDALVAHLSPSVRVLRLTA